MIRFRVVQVCFALLVCLAIGSLTANSPFAQGTPGMNAAAPDSFAAQRDSLMKVVLASIQGRENAPAESVFKDIQVLKGVPAGRVPRIMNMGYGRSLGVGCYHCHVEGDWAKNDKTQKQVARDMVAMANKINTEMLPAIKGIQSEHPFVNCGTCHHGQARPNADMAGGRRTAVPPAGH